MVATDDEDDMKADDDDRTTRRATPLRLNSDAVDLSIFIPSLSYSVLENCLKLLRTFLRSRVEYPSERSDSGVKMRK